MITNNSLPTPHPVLLGEFSKQNTASKSSFGGVPAGDLTAARDAYRERLAAWVKLPLRQQFADETWMRDHIAAAGLRAPTRFEPATVKRLRTLLHRADVGGPEIKTSVGTHLSGFLELNPLLPLWATLALVLESTGKFTRAVVAMAKGVVS